MRVPRLRQIRNSQFGSHRSKILSIFLPDLFLLALFSLALSSPLLAQSNPDSNDTRVQELYAQAKAAEARGDLAAAAQIYESLLQASPRLAPAYNNLGALYLKQHEYRKAATILERGLKIDPKMFSAFALLGIVRYEMGDYAGARRSLEAALHGNPKDGNVELFLANDLIKLDELNLAADHLWQLSQRQPRNQEIWYLLGKVHMKLSEQALSKLNEIDPNSVWWHEISGEVMESMKNYRAGSSERKSMMEALNRVYRSQEQSDVPNPLSPPPRACPDDGAEGTAKAGRNLQSVTIPDEHPVLPHLGYDERRALLRPELLHRARWIVVTDQV